MTSHNTENASLFDKFNRDYLGPSKYSEDEFKYLNRSARLEVKRIRDLLETWYLHYPQAKASDIKSRFRSNNLNHRSAFFELFIHELLLKLGLYPKIHPELPSKISKHPDFFVESTKGNFYIEATTTSSESAKERSKQAIMNSVYDSINTLDSPNFFIGMDIKGTPSTQPPVRKIRSFLYQHLATLKPDELSEYDTSRAPRWLYKYENWEIVFYPIPKKPKARGKKGVRPIGELFHGFHVIDTITNIRNALCAKAGHYGKLNLPYIVAINVLDWSTEETDIRNALFGKNPNGVWISKTGPRYTRLSAILIAVDLSPWNITKAYIKLYHNPWARITYKSELTQLPQAIPVKGKIELKDGRSLSNIFEIPLEWPKLED